MAITVRNLRKEYRTRIKEEGLQASLRALWQPVYKQVTAVDDVSFEVNSGEIIAFIGPNGAGKSTTIKILTGILHPTAGEVSVMGYNPVQNRQRLAMSIGSVFGQRSQLWLHLPPLDSFALLARIYELEEKSYRSRLAMLSELFGIEELLRTPVRKLSLGQRIRCEITASLLHQPKVIFLDEPTIGLDVIVKQRIRELILLLNREEGTTVFLTSHDAGDVEQLCKRVLVIDQGKILLDDSVEDMKRNYLQRKIIEITYSEVPELQLPAGVIAETMEGSRIRLIVDTRLMEVNELLPQLVAGGNIIDLTINNPPMEEIIARIFQHRGGEE